MAGHEVGLEAQDDVGALEPVLGLDRLAEGQLRARADVVAVGGLPAHPPGLGELGAECLQLRGEGGRGRAPGQEPHAGPALLLVEDLAQGLAEGAPGAVLPLIEHGLRAIGIVEAEDVRLAEHVGRPEALRVVGVALDLRRPPLVALHEDAARVAVVGDRGGEVERAARHELLRLPDVGEDLLRGLLRAGGQTGQRQRGPHEGEELPAALRVLEGGGLLRELPVEELQEAGAVRELLEALPVAAATRPPGTATCDLELYGDGGDVILAHR